MKILDQRWSKIGKVKLKPNSLMRFSFPVLMVSLSGFDLLLKYIEAYNLIPQAQYLENTSSHILQSMSSTG